MPRKRRMIQRKRRRKRRTKRANVIPRLTFYSGGIPPQMVVRFKYSQTIALNPSSLLPITTWVFRANSLYDPDSTGTGHQPYLFDFWSQVYKRYTVLGSKMTMMPEQTTSTNNTPGTFGILKSKDPSIPAGWTTDQFFETVNSTGKNNLLAGNIAYSQEGGNRARLTMPFSTRRFFGITDPNDGNSYEGLTGDLIDGSNPSIQAYFIPFYLSNGPSGVGNDPEVMPFRVVIEYIASLTDMRLNIAS